MYNDTSDYIEGNISAFAYVRKARGVKKALEGLRSAVIYSKDYSKRADKRIEALNKELKELSPVYEIVFQPQAYNADDGDYLVKCIGDRISRKKTREEAEAFVELCKKEKFEEVVKERQ